MVVDTRTGEILHKIGHTGTSDDFDSGQEIPPNVLVEAWRSSDGEYYGLVDCCEPAGGGDHVRPQRWIAASGSCWRRLRRLDAEPVSSEWAIRPDRVRPRRLRSGRLPRGSCPGSHRRTGVRLPYRISRLEA